MIDSKTVIAARQAVQEVQEDTQGFIIGVMDNTGKTVFVSGGDIGALSFITLSCQSLMAQIIEGRDPRGKMPIGIKPVPNG